MNYYWVWDSKGNLLRIPENKLKEWDPNYELSEEEERQIERETEQEIEEMIRKLEMKE